MEEANFALPANKKLNHMVPSPSLLQPEVRKKKKRGGGWLKTPNAPYRLITLSGFCGTGEAEKDLRGASRHRAMPSCDRLWGRGSDSKFERVRLVLELTGALGGAGAGGAAAGEGPEGQYLLQKQPHEVLVRTARLTALPHVSRRHQPLARREELAAHVRGGDSCRRPENN